MDPSILATYPRGPLAATHGALPAARSSRAIELPWSERGRLDGVVFAEHAKVARLEADPVPALQGLALELVAGEVDLHALVVGQDDLQLDQRAEVADAIEPAGELLLR